jgi:RNA recognition motif-containing protein
MGEEATVFVGNISWSTDDASLMNHFRAQSLAVASASVQRHQDTGRSKGWGLVTLDTHDTMQLAIRNLNDSELDGRKIIVREGSKEPPAREGGGKPRQARAAKPEWSASNGAGASSNTLYVGNLPWSADTAALTDLFSRACSIAPSSCEVIYGRDGRSRGYGLVSFADKAAAESAMTKISGQQLEGRDVQVRFDKKSG